MSRNSTQASRACPDPEAADELVFIKSMRDIIEVSYTVCSIFQGIDQFLLVRWMERKQWSRGKEFG